MILALLVTLLANAEPSYCNLSNFQNQKQSYHKKNLENLNLYKFNKLYLAGLGIGDSNVDAIIEMVQTYAKATEKEKFCSFYLNEGSSKAAKTFNHYPLPNPKKNFKKVLNAYEDTFIDILNNPNFFACAKKGVIALGCNSMEHRGPTVFGMFLAFTGCEPEGAAEIVNEIWGLNSVPKARRLEIIEHAYELGKINPEHSAYLRELMER